MTEENRKSQAERGSRRTNRDERNDDALEVPRRGFSAAYRDFTDEFDLAELDLDPGVVFGDVRDRTLGRPPGRAFRRR